MSIVEIIVTKYNPQSNLIEKNKLMQFIKNKNRISCVKHVIN